jgi:hypothetical protein
MPLVLHMLAGTTAFGGNSPYSYGNCELSQVPYEYVRLGYEREEHYGYNDYVPRMDDMHMESGAIDEDFQVHPAAQPSDYTPASFDSAAFQKLPAGALASTALQESLGTKWAPNQSDVVAAEYPVWGVTSGFVPAPVALAKHCCAARDELASMTLRAVSGLPRLSDAWQPRLQDPRAGSRCLGDHAAPMAGPCAADLAAACEVQPVRSSASAPPMLLHSNCLQLFMVHASPRVQCKTAHLSTNANLQPHMHPGRNTVINHLHCTRTGWFTTRVHHGVLSASSSGLCWLVEMSWRAVGG